MPLYEFQCDQCKYTIEEIVAVKDRDTHIVQCYECGRPMRRKVPDKMTFKLRGSGWSIDGYSNARDKADLV